MAGGMLNNILQNPNIRPNLPNVGIPGGEYPAQQVPNKVSPSSLFFNKPTDGYFLKQTGRNAIATNNVQGISRPGQDPRMKLQSVRMANANQGNPVRINDLQWFI